MPQEEAPQRRWPKVGFGEIGIDVLQARFWIVSVLPTIQELLPDGSNENAECGQWECTGPCAAP